MKVAFKVKCVSCAVTELRPADECHEMQFCTKCGSPMTVEDVTRMGTPEEKNERS